MKKEVRINFSDFYPGFEKTNNYFFKLLSSKYFVTIDEITPDFLIYSCFGNDFLKFDCIRIFYSGENIIPDFNLCDYGIGFVHLSFEDRYIRFPNFLTYRSKFEKIKKEGNENFPPERKFCNFIYSNPSADPIRDQFYYLLSKYKKVDSAGKHLNNTLLPVITHGWSEDKLKFMKDYKFSIAFENSSLPGYTTEKIVDAFLSGTIPIYWGDPTVSNDFNPAAFINCHSFKNFEKVVDEVIKIDHDESLFKKMINQPIFLKEPEYFNLGYLLSFFSNIFEQPIEMARRRTKYGQCFFYEKNQKRLLNKIDRGEKRSHIIYRKGIEVIKKLKQKL
jgi:hypothetical protein